MHWTLSMAGPSQRTVETLRRRCERLARMLGWKLSGQNVPEQALSDELRMVEEALRQYRAEEAAENN